VGAIPLHIIHDEHRRTLRRDCHDQTVDHRQQPSRTQGGCPPNEGNKSAAAGTSDTSEGSADSSQPSKALTIGTYGASGARTAHSHPTAPLRFGQPPHRKLRAPRASCPRPPHRGQHRTRSSGDDAIERRREYREFLCPACETAQTPKCRPIHDPQFQPTPAGCLHIKKTK
jgi:hypothetical protein